MTIKIKRGDMVLVELLRSFTSASFKHEEWTEWELMTVTGLTRAGEIREVRDDRYEGDRGTPQKFANMLYATGSWKLLPASRWDLAKALDLAKGHTYPKNNTPRGFKSLDQARGVLSPARQS